MATRLETLVIQVTTACPNNCPQCYMQRGHENISLDVAKEHIDALRDGGAVAVQITGGEPLVYPELDRLLEHIGSRGMLSTLATSGYSHSKERYSELKSRGLSAICISINDILENANALTRDGFAESLSAIRDARKARLMCFCNVVVTDENVERLELLGAYLSSLGVVGINVLRPVRSYDGRYVPKLSQKTIKRIKRTVDSNGELYRVENCFREYWEYVSGEPFSCADIGERAVFINVDGTVSPCSKTSSFKYKSIEEMKRHESSWIGGCYHG